MKCDMSTASVLHMNEASVLDVARTIATGQGALANSPAEVAPDGHIQLCLASCYAAAGLAVAIGPVSRSAFERELSVSFDKADVERVYARLGWDVEECRRKMKYNDSLPPSRRLESAFGL